MGSIESDKNIILIDEFFIFYLNVRDHSYQYKFVTKEKDNYFIIQFWIKKILLQKSQQIDPNTKKISTKQNRSSTFTSNKESLNLFSH